MTDFFKEQEEKEARLYPEIRQGLEVLNEAGEWVIGYEKEPFTAYARGFVFSGIIGLLNGDTVKVLNIVASLTNRFRNTTHKDETIIKYANICQNTLTKAFRELKFYHIISSHYLPGGGLKKKRRCISINRWDTARPRLIKENKIVVGLDKKVIHLIPNPYRKK